MSDMKSETLPVDGNISTNWDDFNENWYVDDTLLFIKQNNATIIGLQFPDYLLKYSVKISKILELKLKGLNNNNTYKICILADTTMAPCCVDEIAGLHVKTDVIIHYGFSCCSQTKRIKVFNVLPQKNLDIKLLQLCVAKQKNLFDKYKKILILYEYCYDKYRRAFIDIFLKSNMKQLTKKFIIARIDYKLDFNKNKSDNIIENGWKMSQCVKFCGYYYPTFFDNSNIDFDDLSNIKKHYGVLFIGNNDDNNQLYLSLLSNYGSYLTFMSYNPNLIENKFDSSKDTKILNNELESYRFSLFEVNQNVMLLSKILIYRFNLIEKIKNANIIGIVVGTLVVDGYLNVLNILKNVIHKANKKYYLISVGKVNEAKLGNFSEVDIFVLITCSLSFQYLLPSQQESYFKNIVTPFDVMIALDNSCNWTGMYSTDFNDILLNTYKLGINESKDEDSKGNSDDSEIRYSAIDGKLYPKNNGNNNIDQFGNKQLIGFNKPGNIVKYDAAAYMKKRSWKGVSMVDDSLKPAKLEQGLSGIPTKYNDEI